MKHFTLFIALLSICSSLWADKILTAHPVTQELARALTLNTDIQVQTVSVVPLRRLTSYLQGRGATELKKQAITADAVISMSSIWPTDPLYAHARRSNIRIVEIDAMRPIDGMFSGIAVKNDDDFSAYPWLSTNNLMRMSDIIANDLSRLYPQFVAVIAKNAEQLKQQLKNINFQAQQQMAEVQNTTVINLSHQLVYFLDDLSVDVLNIRSEKWTEQDIQKLLSSIEDNEAVLVIHHEALPETVQTALNTTGVNSVILDTDSQHLLEMLNANIAKIYTGLKK